MSDRSLDADLEAGATSGVFPYILFVALYLDSGTIRAHNGQGTYTFGGNSYYGVGAYGNIEAMEESVNAVANPVKVTLSTITPELITAVRTDNVYKRAAEIYVGKLDENLELEGTPTLWIDGYIEKKELVLGETNGLAFTVQDDAAKLEQRNNKRYTLEEHQRRFPGDQFLEYLPYVQDAATVWAGEQVRTGFVNNGSVTGGNTNTRRDNPRGGNGRR